VLRRLPHTIGLVTDLDGRQTIRTLQMLAGEMKRREQKLTAAGVADIEKYHEAGFRDPFPYLFIVIDEFAELRDRFRFDLEGVVDKFISVAQKGRALGVHLLMAMQKPEGVVNDRIRANMKLRICLRVERSEDSKNVLGTPDAYLLPANPPGRAYYRVGNFDEYDQFQVARIAGEYQPEKNKLDADEDFSIYEFCPDGSRVVLIQNTMQSEKTTKNGSMQSTDAEIFVQIAAKVAGDMKLKKLPGPWIDPLPDKLDLEQLIQNTSENGINLWNWDQDKKAAVVGLVDDPVNQQQFPYLLDLSEGSTLIAGSPGSGRTTFLQTAVFSLARSYPPDELHIHILDFAGHKLRASFFDFPHVGGIYEPGEEERILKLLRYLTENLDQRRLIFLNKRAVDLFSFNKQASEDEKQPKILIVINNYSKFRDEYQRYLSEWLDLFREGSVYGITFLLATDRPLSGREMELIKNRVVLSMIEKSHYGILLGGKTAFKKKLDIPGRGYLSGKKPLELQIASPAAGGEERWISCLNDAGREMSNIWKGKIPRRFKALPEEVCLSEICGKISKESFMSDQDKSIPFALEEQDLAPAWYELKNFNQSFLVCGPPASGKSTTLETILSGISFLFTMHQLEILVISHKHGIKQDRFKEYPQINFLDSSSETWTEKLRCFLERTLSNKKSGVQPGGRSFLVIDDLQLVSMDMEACCGSLLDRCFKPEASPKFWSIASVSIAGLHSPNRLIRRYRSCSCGVWLVSTDSTEALKVGIRIPKSMCGRDLPSGRGIYFTPSGQKVIQVALPESSGNI